jgi:predicted nucleic acid-binding protein
VERCKEVVLDTSVVVKWFSAEIKTDEALRLRESYMQGLFKLTVSEILIAEVANALRYKPDYDTEKLRRAVASLLGLHLNIIHLNETIVTRAVEIAYEGQVTFYDALPVAIAERRKALCITADEATQYKRLKPKGYPIELL